MVFCFLRVCVVPSFDFVAMTATEENLRVKSEFLWVGPTDPTSAPRAWHVRRPAWALLMTDTVQDDGQAHNQHRLS